jgi:two-component system nitrogen regulation response regulator NtrX
MKPKRFNESAIDYFKGLSWPGNIRELKNTVERIAIFSTSNEIGLKDVKAYAEETRSVGGATLSGEIKTYSDFKEKTESTFLREKLEENGWNVSETARKLGMQRSNLYKKIEKYSLSKED